MKMNYPRQTHDTPALTGCYLVWFPSPFACFPPTLLHPLTRAGKFRSTLLAFEKSSERCREMPISYEMHYYLSFIQVPRFCLVFSEVPAVLGALAGCSGRSRETLPESVASSVR